MPKLLTVRQLQDILKVDRTTIYRMLGDNTLPGFKVGSQWRFSGQAISEWLESHQQGYGEPEASRATTPLTRDLLPIPCVQPIQDVFAEALEVGSVTTDVAGQPMTEFSNKSRFCQLINSTEAGRARCRQSWAEQGHQSKKEPAIARCHAGLSYARGRVEVADELIAMIFAGQFVVESPDSIPTDDEIWALAENCELDPEPLVAASKSVRRVSPAEADRIMRLLSRVTDTFCHIGNERAELFGRFEDIAQITGSVMGSG